MNNIQNLITGIHKKIEYIRRHGRQLLQMYFKLFNAINILCKFNLENTAFCGTFPKRSTRQSIPLCTEFGEQFSEYLELFSLIQERL